jgi:hypothetical protein
VLEGRGPGEAHAGDAHGEAGGAVGAKKKRKRRRRRRVSTDAAVSDGVAGAAIPDGTPVAAATEQGSATPDYVQAAVSAVMGALRPDSGAQNRHSFSSEGKRASLSVAGGEEAVPDAGKRFSLSSADTPVWASFRLPRWSPPQPAAAGSFKQKDASTGPPGEAAAAAEPTNESAEDASAGEKSLERPPPPPPPPSPVRIERLAEELIKLRRRALPSTRTVMHTHAHTREYANLPMFQFSSFKSGPMKI